MLLSNMGKFNPLVPEAALFGELFWKQEEVVKGKEYRLIIDMYVFSRAHEAGGGGQG